MACEFCGTELFVRKERYLTREVGDPRTGGMTAMTVTYGKGGMLCAGGSEVLPDVWS